MGVLNPSQLEIIKLFESHKTEEDLKKLKRALIQYLLSVLPKLLIQLLMNEVTLKIRLSNGKQRKLRAILT